MDSWIRAEFKICSHLYLFTFIYVNTDVINTNATV